MEARKYIKNIKKNNPCVICGSTENLHFHHLISENKKYNISDMVKMRSSIKSIQAEIDKCVILCRTCHEKVHNGELNL